MIIVNNISHHLFRIVDYRNGISVFIAMCRPHCLSNMLILTIGGGRCNVMHDPRKGPKEIAKGYPRGNRELLGPLTSKFGPDETYNWFTSRGVVLKVEEDGRVRCHSYVLIL